MNYYNYFWLIGVHSISDVKQKIKRSNLIFVCFIILRLCYDHPFPWTVLLTLPFIEKAQVIKKGQTPSTAFDSCLLVAKQNINMLTIILKHLYENIQIASLLKHTRTLL